MLAVPVCWDQAANAPSPADGHTVHGTAPHVVADKVMMPYHHYCKVLSPEPVIECLCYSNEAGLRPRSLAPETCFDFAIFANLVQDRVRQLRPKE
jgi:hypothetical protein